MLVSKKYQKIPIKVKIKNIVTKYEKLLCIDRVEDQHFSRNFLLVNCGKF